jgi:hypothetical protein
MLPCCREVLSSIASLVALTLAPPLAAQEALPAALTEAEQQQIRRMRAYFADGVQQVKAQLGGKHMYGRMPLLRKSLHLHLWHNCTAMLAAAKEYSG